MKKIVFLSLMVFVLLCACEESNSTQQPNTPANAKVIGRGGDCGNTYLIQFNENVSGVPENIFDNTFYALNLPENLQINGLEIHVEFREPSNDEFMFCTTMGIGYPQIFIVAAHQ